MGIMRRKHKCWCNILELQIAAFWGERLICDLGVKGGLIHSFLSYLIFISSDCFVSDFNHIPTYPWSRITTKSSHQHSFWSHNASDWRLSLELESFFALFWLTKLLSIKIFSFLLLQANCAYCPQFTIQLTLTRTELFTNIVFGTKWPSWQKMIWMTIQNLKIPTVCFINL
jgi:hypothetical protein